MSHPNAILKLSRRVSDILVFARSVSNAMSGSALFPSPNPSLAILDADIDELDAAQATLLSRLKGAKEVRDEKLVTLREDLEQERAYVQKVANADPASAPSIILTAGMYVRQFTPATKNELAAKPGLVSGAVSLVAKSAGDRASYEWQVSTDGKSWTNLPVTLQARTTLYGSTTEMRYFFRVRPVTKAGEGAWSHVVSLIVM